MAEQKPVESVVTMEELDVRKAAIAAIEQEKVSEAQPEVPAAITGKGKKSKKVARFLRKK
jgi:hypothetical protein